MTVEEAIKLQRKLKRKGHVSCTLLVVPTSIQDSPGADIDFPVGDPFVISGTLNPSGFFVPEKDESGDWHGVFSVMVDRKEIPVQWIREHVMGPAYTLVDPKGFPCAIFSSWAEANKEYVRRWPPRMVHEMSHLEYPKLLEPSGRLTRPSFSQSMGNYSLDYPWHA